MTTHQQVFDFIVSRALEQGRRSIVGGTCLYRSPNGHKCFAGFMIPDDVYDRFMEGKSIAGVVQHAGAKLAALDPVLQLLSLLQLLHDHVQPHHWTAMFYRVGKDLGLDTGTLKPAHEWDPSHGQDRLAGLYAINLDGVRIEMNCAKPSEQPEKPAPFKPVDLVDAALAKPQTPKGTVLDDALVKIGKMLSYA